MASPSEIVVVGAGIIGCAVAYELARRGASVTVVDDRAPGMGATQASAGVLAPFIESRDEGPLLELTSRSLALFDAYIEQVRSDSECVVPYQRTGTLDVATEPESLNVLEATRTRLARRGVDAQLLDATEVRRCETHLSVAAIGGLLIPSHGFVGAAALVNALAIGARRYGAKFVVSGRVHRVCRDGDTLSLVTAGPAHERLSADVAILAAGSWAGQIKVDGVDSPLPVRPIRGQLLHLQWEGTPPRHVLWGERCYIVPWDDGTVLVGATEEDAGFEERTTLAGIQDLIEAACELLPHAWAASLLTAKAGLRPGTPDQVPIIGWSSRLPKLLYATGHYRNGILLAPLTAELVANAVLDGRTDPMLELTRPQRFGGL